MQHRTFTIGFCKEDAHMCYKSYSIKGFQEEVVVVVSEAVAGAVTVGGALIACAWDAVCFLAVARSYSSSFVRFEFNY